MLTGDLVRFRIERDTIRPLYITRHMARDYLYICDRIFHIFRSHKGKTRMEIESALAALEGERMDFKVIRGLVKLLLEKCEFTPRIEIDYTSLRKRIFQAAQRYYPIVSKPDLLHTRTRNHVLIDIAKETELKVEDVDSLLYGDLPENLVMTRFKTDFTPETLLKRYNLALAQGLLYRSLLMQITLKRDYRTVIQYLKLSRLIHWIEPLPDNQIRILVDGPASLFRLTQRYGVRMAMFLPGLLLSKDWEMVANIQTEKGVKHFYLDSDCGLTSHYSAVPLFDSLIEERFFNKFSRKDRTWTIERESEIFDLGDTIFIPDFTFRHPDGRTANLEIVGFWTPEYLQKKIEKIRRSKRSNLFLAVNNQLNCSRDDFPCEVLSYRKGIKIGEVLKMLEKVGEKQVEKE